MTKRDASKKEIAAEFETLKATYVAALAAARAERTRSAREAAVAASRAVAEFGVRHDLLPKPRGFASRAGQRVGGSHD